MEIVGGFVSAVTVEFGKRMFSEFVSHRPVRRQAVDEILKESVKSFEAFQSRENVLQGILKALKDPNVQRVGVYGMGGVGKTMLVKVVATEARKQKLFDRVAIATISNSKQTDIKGVQHQIAAALGMKLDENCELGGAFQLWEWLKNAMGVLIILDDVWDKFKLEDLGILFKDDQKISTKRHKLLFTSRDRILLSNDMRVEPNFEVRVLSQEEGMELFGKIIGGDIMAAPGYGPIAADIVKKCDGLPVAISAIANALKPLSLDDWRDALVQIERRNPTTLGGFKEVVYFSLELSYKHLRNEGARRIFLLCSLMPQGSNINVSDLTKYSWGLGVLGDIRTLCEARRRVTSVVNKLKSSSLLLGGVDNCGNNDDEYVKVHDIVRDVSITTASENEQLFVVDDKDHLKELLKEAKLKKCTALSLPYSDIQVVPLDMLASAELELVLLFSKHEYLNVPDGVIKEDNKLKVLDLSLMDFASSLSSFRFLTNLRTLCLKDCRGLSDISIIGMLKELEILSFEGSDIVQLPKELAQLSELKLLDLKRCFNLQVIPANLISQLCRLEELYVGEYSFKNWDAKGNASLAELKHLDRLIALDIYIPNVQKMPENLFSEKLERFEIRIGLLYYMLTNTSRRILHLSGIHVDHSIEMLLKRTEDLCLKNVEICVTNFIFASNLTKLVIEECDNMRNLFTSSMARSLVQLKFLQVSDCESMIEIIAKDEEEIVDATKFELPSMASLQLFRLPKLKSFSCKTIIEWPSLKTMEVHGCDRMKFLFANSEEVSYDRGQQGEEEREAALFWANEDIFPCLESLTWYSEENLKEVWKGELVSQCFPNLKNLTCGAVNLHVKQMGLFPSLEELEIEYGSMEEILQGEGSEFILSSVPKLSQLKLSNLDKLVRLWDEKCEPGGSFFLKLMTLEVQDCGKLKKLVPSAKSFPNLVTMDICRCDGLINLLTHSSAKSFVQLKTMRIADCTTIEGIIGEDEAEDSIIFEQLKYLELKNLPSLECFCLTKCSFEFPFLDQLIIVSCPKLKIFCHGALNTPKLQSLHLSEGKDGKHRAVNDRDLNKSIQEIFREKIELFCGLCEWDFTKFPELVELLKNSNPQTTSAFKNITKMRVCNCKSTSSGHLFTPSMVMCLVNLDELEVKECPMIEQVIAKEVQAATCKIILPQLTRICLNRCFSLTSFCVGSYSFECPKLEYLVVENCPKMVTFLKEQEKEAMTEAFFSEKANFPTLQYLSLTSINVQTIWSDAIPIMPILDILTIKDCEIMKAVITTKEELMENLMFLKLHSLYLKDLPKLKSFCFTIDSDTLLLFDQKVNFPNLGILSLISIKIQTIWSGALSTLPKFLFNLKIQDCENMEAVVMTKDESMENLTLSVLLHLRLEGLSKLKSFCSSIDSDTHVLFDQRVNFPNLGTLTLISINIQTIWSDASPTMPELNTLTIQDCENMEAIVMTKDESMENLMFPELSQLTLEGLPKLTSFCSIIDSDTPSLFDQMVWFPELKEIKITRLNNVKILWDSQIPTYSFCMLRTLKVKQCWNLKALFPLSVARGLVRLEELDISFCGVEEIVLEEQGSQEINNVRFEFPKLTEVKLHNLPKLKSFCPGMCTILDCPKLKILDSFHCNKLKMVAAKHWAGDLNSTIQQLYAEKGGYQILNYLDFSKSPELIDIRNGNLQETLKFKNLESLQVCNYNSSGYLFTLSMASLLQKLCTLKVQHCTTIEHVIAETEFDGSQKVKDGILFPLLESMLVESCPSLTSFFLLGRDTFECAYLNEITVIDCPKMVAFASAFSREQNKDTTQESDKDDFHYGSFFTEKVQLPSLVRLKLSSTNIQKIWDDSKLPTIPSCIQQLTELIVESCRNLRYLLPSSLVKGCAQLETLEICDCKLINGVIFTNDSAEEERIAGSGVPFEFPYLRNLVIENCPSLETFISKSLTRNETVTSLCILCDEKVALDSLETLKLRKIAAKAVWRRHILAPPCLLQLRRMSITDCDMMKEIITCVADEVSRDGIVFYQLKYLELGCLPNLESFCSQECTLEFPSLKEVSVKVCPNMKTFSRGETSTPKLQKLQLTEGEDEELCEGGLNTTIQKLFAKDEHL